MSEINVVAAPAAQNEATFTRAVRKSISTIANLAGWTREEREFLMGSVEGHPACDRHRRRQHPPRWLVHGG
jgi:hypothetical protein